jgi:hypothetical protein
MSDLKCYWCFGHGFVLVNGEKVECRECGGCGLDADVIREREAYAKMEADDREWARERDRRSGAHHE